MSSADEPQEANAVWQIDTTKPSSARVYDAFVGGKDHYEVDREVYRKILEIAPEAPESGRLCREWLIRVVRFMAGHVGIDQFLDCGAGLPTAENTHQTAQRILPEAQTVYVDNDPMVAAHGRALLEENDRTHFAVADLAHPDELLQHPTVTKYLDFQRPIGLIQCNTMHHVPGEARPHDIMRTYVDVLPSGSYVALCHLCAPPEDSEYAELAKDAEQRLMSLMGTCYFRPKEDILAFFDGLEVVEPGLVELFNWWPDGPSLNPPPPGHHLLVGAVGRKA